MKVDLGIWNFDTENPRDWFILGLIILFIGRTFGVFA